MPSLFPRFKQKLRETADARSTKVRKGHLYGHSNIVDLRGMVQGTLYVRPNSHAKSWRVTENGVERLLKRDSSWGLVLLYPRADEGYFLPPELVERGVEDWELNSKTGQYGIQAADPTKEEYPFLSIEELFGMLRIAWSDE